jgi:hypothetical protein
MSRGDAASFERAMPSADCIVVEEKNAGDSFATHSAVKQEKGVGSPGHAMLFKPVPRNTGKGYSFGVAEEARSDHAESFDDSPAPVKKRFIQNSEHTLRTFVGGTHFWRLSPATSQGHWLGS